MSWRDRAACLSADQDLFYPEKADWAAARDAARICRRCPVQTACLEYALVNGERVGVWGGYTERERHRLVRGVAA